jgi:hypothetical protein
MRRENAAFLRGDIAKAEYFSAKDVDFRREMR